MQKFYRRFTKSCKVTLSFIIKFCKKYNLSFQYLRKFIYKFEFFKFLTTIIAVMQSLSKKCVVADECGEFLYFLEVDCKCINLVCTAQLNILFNAYKL